MSRAFLTTAPAFDTYPGLLIAVEIAWGADLTDTDGSGWTWDDVTDEVILSSGGDAAEGAGISIAIGRPDFSQESQTSEMTCVLDNRSSEYSEGGQSPHWPYVRRGTPVRVRVSTDNGSTWKLRFQGSVNGFTPMWDPETGRWATVTLSASGPLRRLNQGTLPAVSAFKSNIMSSGDTSIVGYWPLEDGVNSTTCIAAYPTTAVPYPMTPYRGGSAFLAQGNTNGPFLSSAPLPFGGSFEAPNLRSFTNTGVIKLSVLCTFPPSWFEYAGAGLATYQVLLAIMTNSSSGYVLMATVENADSVGDLELRYYSGNLSAAALRYSPLGSFPGSPSYNSGNINFTAQGLVGLLELTIETNGDYQIRTRNAETGQVLSFAGSGGSGSGVGDPYLISVHPNFGYGDPGTMIMGHAVLQNSATITPGITDRLTSYAGEEMLDRIQRLCDVHGLHLTTLNASVGGWFTPTDNMGPQPYDTLTNLLRECERTGQGFLFDGLGPGLTYAAREYRESKANSSPSLTIDASLGQMMEPFAPIDDDQLTINSCDATRRNGTTVTYLDRTGPMGAEAIGTFTTSIDVNPQNDANLIEYAQWVVGIGSRTGYRYPSVTFALETNPGLVPGWLACTPMCRIDVKNIASIRRQHPDHDIRLLIEGWHEEITAFTWRVTANTSPQEPWNVIRLAAATGSTSDGVGRLQTVGSQLNANAAAGATSVSVKTTSGNIWVTTAVDADSFPFDAEIGGAKVRVTAISGASSPQTFTLASPGLPRAMTGSTTTGAAGVAPVKVWRPPVYAI